MPATTLRAISGALPSVLFASATVAQDRWQLLAAAPMRPRFEAVAHVVGEQVLVFGGKYAAETQTREMLDGALWNGASGSWHAIQAWPLGERVYPALVGTRSGLLCTGGYDGSGKPAGTGAWLDPTTRTWRQLPPWPVRPRLQPSVAVDGDDVVLFGGNLTHSQGATCTYEWFDDGLWIDTRRGTIRAIPRGPLAPRHRANLHLRAGQLLVVGGYVQDRDSRRQPRTDAAVFDLHQGTWKNVALGDVAGRADLDIVPYDDRLAFAGRNGQNGRSVVASLWHPGQNTFANIPGTEHLDFGVDGTWLLGHGNRVLLFNSGMKVSDDRHQAFWLAADGAGWIPIALPGTVRPRQAYTFASGPEGRDAVLFGGNHDIRMGCSEPLPDEREREPPFLGYEADGLHFDLARGLITPIPAGPLAARARPLCAFVRDRLFVLWGNGPGHRLFADGALYRLR